MLCSPFGASRFCSGSFALNFWDYRLGEIDQIIENTVFCFLGGRQTRGNNPADRHVGPAMIDPANHPVPARQQNSLKIIPRRAILSNVPIDIETFITAVVIGPAHMENTNILLPAIRKGDFPGGLLVNLPALSYETDLRSMDTAFRGTAKHNFTIDIDRRRANITLFCEFSVCR